MKRMVVFRINLAIVMVILFCSHATARQECNLYNFVMDGAHQCAVAWWEDSGFEYLIYPEVTYSISDVVETALRKHDVNLYETINTTFFGILQEPFSSPFTKFVEGVLTTEPFLTVLIADFVAGMELTRFDTNDIGITPELASKEKLILVIQEYLDYGCTSVGTSRFSSCMKVWTNGHCNPYEDRISYITWVLQDLKNVYCDGYKSRKVNPEVLNTFSEDLGSMSQALSNFFGIVKDENSPYVFNLTQGSILTDPQELIDELEESCGFYVTALTPDVQTLLDPNSTVGTGFFVKNMMGIYKSFVKCGIDRLATRAPDMFTETAREKYKIVLEKYSLAGVLEEEHAEEKKERHTVSVFGDPHMIIYKEFIPITCSALGWQTYLFNEYFHLKGFAEPAVNGSAASYVTKVRIDFLKSEAPSHYLSEEGVKPYRYLAEDVGTQLSETRSMKIKEVRDGIQISQDTSGAVFAFSKFRDTYYFSVRMGKDVFERSYGLLIGECTDIIDIDKKRRKRSLECDESCSAVDEVYKDTCLFDCDVTGDARVGEISVGIRALQRDVLAEDEKALESQGIHPSKKPDGKGGDGKSNTDDGDGGSGSQLSVASGLLTSILLSYVLTFI